MALPKQADVEDALLTFLGLHHRPVETRQVYIALAEKMSLSAWDRRQVLKTSAGQENEFENIVRRARQRLVDKGWLAEPRVSGKGLWALTAEGKRIAYKQERFGAGTLTLDELFGD